MIARVPDHLVPTEAKIALLLQWANRAYDNEFKQIRQVGRWLGAYHLDANEEGTPFIVHSQFFVFEDETAGCEAFEGLTELERAV